MKKQDLLNLISLGILILVFFMPTDLLANQFEAEPLDRLIEKLNNIAFMFSRLFGVIAIVGIGIGFIGTIIGVPLVLMRYSFFVGCVSTIVAMAINMFLL